MTPQILIAGIGNIFMGDDAFGVEVAQELASRAWPEGVRVIDFGIRGFDLACALTDESQAVILVDAIGRGEPPGTICVLEIDPDHAPTAEGDNADGHGLTPASAIALANSLGSINARLFLVGCEPAVLESDEVGLSDSVRAAVPEAVRLIEEIVDTILSSAPKSAATLRAATQNIL